MIIHNPILTGSFTFNGTDVSSVTGSSTYSASFASSINSLNAATASLNSFSASVNTFTASAATTGSNTFVGNQVVTGSLNVSGSITTPGTLTAQTLVVQTITSSVDFVTGSTRFGSIIGNTHQFTGSMSVSGSGTFVSALSGTSATFTLANSTLYAPLSEASRYPTASQIYLSNTNAATDSFSGITFQVTRASGTNTNAYIGAVSTTLNPAIVFGQRDGSNNLYTERMRINSSGNVGIGTTSPASQATGTTTGILDISNSSGGNLVLHRTGGGDTALFSILKASNGTYIDSTGAATAANNAIIFRVNNTNGDQTTVNTALRIESDRKVVVNADDNGIILRAATTDRSIFYELQNSSSTRRGYMGYGGNSSALFEISNNENGAIDFRTNSAFAARITSGGNVLIGTTTDSSYKLAVASGHQYLGSGFQITGTFGQVDRQCATAFADFAGTTVTFDLASLFPRTTFTNRGLSVTMQLVALPTYTIVSSAFVVLGRTGNSNVWSNSILANININGAAINSVSASGTVITIVYSTYIFGTAYINLATIG